MHTRDQGEDMPWWRVDLQENINVGYVNVVGRRDCCWDRMSNYLITVGPNSNPRENLACPGNYNQDQLIYCNMVGRYVGLVQIVPGVLNMAEVQVFMEDPKNSFDMETPSLLA